MTTSTMHLSRRAFVGGAAVFGIASLAVPHSAFAAPTSTELQAQADAVRVKLDDMQARLNKASDDYFTALEAHDEAMAKMEKAQVRIDENNVKIADLQECLGGRARSMYRNGRTTFLDVLLGSNSFEDFISNWDALTAMNNSDAEMVATTKTLREDNEKQKAEYKTQADTAKAKMDEANSIKTEAEGLVAEYQAEVDSLDAEVAELVEKERKAAAEAAAKKAEEEFKRQQRQKQKEEEAKAAAEAAANDEPDASSDADQDTGANDEPDAASDAGWDTGANDDESGQPSASDEPGQSDEDVDGGNDDGNDDGNDEPEPSAPSGNTGGGKGSPNTAALGVAQSQLGVPYVWGGTTPGVGLDCSGLTSYCYSATGYNIGRTTGAQYASARYILPIGEAEPGDVLYNDGHVGICALSGGGRYIHAPQPGEVVCYCSWNQFYCALRW